MKARREIQRPATENDERDERIGELYSQGLGRREIRQLMPDVTGGMLDNIIKKHRVAEEAREQGRLEAAPLSPTAQKKYDARLRQFEREFDQRVWVAARQLHDKWREDGLKNYFDRLTKFERQLASRPGIMKQAEYRTLMMVCHPDTGANASEEKRNEAMRILTQYRLRLMDEKEDPFKDRHGLPRTVADLEKARAEVRARNSARSKAAWAARRERQQG